MCVALAPALALGAGAVSAMGQVMAGQSAKAQANYNASVARENAEQEVQAYQTERGQQAQERTNFWRQVGQIKGQQVTSMAANNIDPGFGSGARLQADTQKLADEDASTLYSNEQMKDKGYLVVASNYDAESVADKAQGKAAQTNSYFGAVSSLLGAASQAAGMKAAGKFGSGATGM